MQGCEENFKIEKKCRVLLVEDNPIIQKVHRNILEKIGCEVDLAENGCDALIKSKNIYDLIFIDIGLPGMDGLQVTSHIRRFSSDAYIPIITLTAYGDKEAKANSLAAGSDEVITKPVSLFEFLRVLKRWILV